MAKVFIINESSHDYNDAKRYGELVFLSSGLINRYATNQMVREFSPKLLSSTFEDYILITGLSVMSCIACSMFAALHNRLNLLLYRVPINKEDNNYVERTIILNSMERIS